MRKLLALMLVYLFFAAGCADYREELSHNKEYKSFYESTRNIKTFKGLLFEDAWRLIIDGRRQHEGPYVFDAEEPGYLSAMSSSLQYALENLSAPVNLDLIENLHNLATKTVQKIDPKNKNRSEFLQGMGRHAVKINLIKGVNTTKQGLIDLEKKVAGDPFRELKKDEGKTILLWKEISSLEMSKLAQTIIERYEQSQKSVKDIVVLAQDLELIQPWADGNLRPLGMVLLHKEFARNGYTPVIFYNPNRIDGNSVDEIIAKEIVPGQKKFKSLVKNAPKHSHAHAHSHD